MATDLRENAVVMLCPVGMYDISPAIHRWVDGLKEFAWQEGYGAFSIGISVVEDTIAYIRAREEHHRKRTFEEEFIVFLKKHGITYDERYVWG